MQPIQASYGITGDGQTAVIEMSAASGLDLIPRKEGNVMHTTTYGTGELIADAIDRGCRNFIIGVGGSATNDAGVGMMQALVSDVDIDRYSIHKKALMLCDY